MRRAFLLLSLALIAGACTRAQALPPEEVLQRAMQAVRSMQSVRFDVLGTIEQQPQGGPRSLTNIALNGWSQIQSQQLQFSFTVNNAQSQEQAMQGEVILAGPMETYLKLQGPSSSMIGDQWWKLPSSSSTPTAAISPDPQLLKMQLQSIRVTRDYGLSEYKSNLSYHYDVEVDSERLLSYLAQVADERKQPFSRAEWEQLLNDIDMKGTLWIDAQTFQIQRLEWNITSIAKQEALRIRFSVEFSEVNAAPLVTPPRSALELPASTGLGDLAPLPDATLLDTLLGAP